MKKIIVFLLLLVAVLNLSCSTDVTETIPQVPNEEQALTALNNDFKVINADYEKQLSQTRMSWFKRALLTVIADVGSYIENNSLGEAVTASVQCWKKHKKKDLDDLSVTTVDKNGKSVWEDYTLDDFKASALQDANNFSTIGKAHNSLSIRISSEISNNPEVLSTSEMIECVNSSLTNNDELYNRFYTPTTNPELVDQIVNTIDFNKSIRDNVNNCKKLTNDKSKQQIWDICGTVIEGLENVSDEDTQYVKLLNKSVTDSSLSPELQKQLLDCISIAESSARLWNSNNSK